MAAKGTCLVSTFVTYEKLHEQGRERGLTATQLAKLDLVLGSGLDGLRRAHAAGVRIESGSDLLGPLARHKARELAIKASALGAHQTLIATTKTNAKLRGIGAETGTIEPGKRADLLVVDGDPLADIALLQHPDNLMAIVKEGQLHKRQI
jgi:imidazolonepropionase-like amidohydrolase